MAALWDLPVIYFCENNNFAMGTSVERSTKDIRLFNRMHSVPGLRVDGMSVFEVREALRFAKKHCIEKGPLFLEVDTYRYYGHSMSDPGSTYRTRDDVSDVRKTRDPILLLKKTILDNKAATEEELKTIEKEIRKEIDQAVEQARNDPIPDDKELFTDIMAAEGGFARAVEYEGSQF